MNASTPFSAADCRPTESSYTLDTQRASTGTLMGLHFLFHGADNGEPGVLATFQENTTQLARIASGFGWDFTKSDVHVLGRSPVDLHVDEWAYDLLACIERTGARRVVLDSPTGIRSSRACCHAGHAPIVIRRALWTTKLASRPSLAR